LRRVAAQYAHSRAQCLHEISAGRPPAALAHARQCLSVERNEESLRLVAVSALLCEEWDTAAQMSQACE
jgi:hypothetical protein